MQRQCALHVLISTQLAQVTGAPLVKEAMKKLSAQYVQARQEFMAQRPPMDRAQAIVAEYPTKMKQLKKVRADKSGRWRNER